MRSYSRDKNVVLNLSATKDAVLNVCSLFCGLDFVCALSFCGLPTKNVVLTQRYPKHAVLKVPISQPQQPLQSPSFAQHIFIDLATCHCSLRYPLLWLLLHTPPKLPQISPFFKIRVVHWQIHFFCWPKNTRFSTPQNSTYIRVTDLQTRFLRSTDSVDSSDTLSFAISPKLGEL